MNKGATARNMCPDTVILILVHPHNDAVSVLGLFDDLDKAALLVAVKETVILFTASFLFSDTFHRHRYIQIVGHLHRLCLLPASGMWVDRVSKPVFPNIRVLIWISTGFNQRQAHISLLNTVAVLAVV